MIEVHSQGDQMARLNVQYLAIYGNESLPNSIKSWLIFYQIQ